MLHQFFKQRYVTQFEQSVNCDVAE